MEIELLAIVYAVLRLRTSLIENTFYIITDHQTLTFLFKTPYQNSRLLRRSLILQEYTFVISHCKGQDNLVANYFSRVLVVSENDYIDALICALNQFYGEITEEKEQLAKLYALDRIDLLELQHI